MAAKRNRLPSERAHGLSLGLFGLTLVLEAGIPVVASLGVWGELMGLGSALTAAVSSKLRDRRVKSMLALEQNHSESENGGQVRKKTL